MQAQYCLTEKFSSFLRILSAHRTAVIIILLLALTCRMVLTFRFSLVAPDERRYTVPAVNMLAGHGFSVALDPPYLPTKQAMPLYPLFVAGVYAVFGTNNVAVRIAQDLLDLVTCVLIAFVAFSLAPMRVRYAAAIAALAIYGFLSWFTLHWTRFVLTETLAIFLTTLAIAAAVLALERRWFWAVAGGVCGLALLTRADSVLLIAAFGFFLLLQIARTRTVASAGSLLMFCAAILMVMAPWTLRNYIAFGRFEPLASEYGFARDDKEMAVGYLSWIRTWITDETHFQVFLPAFANQSFNPDELPDDIFDSPEEKARVLELLESRSESGGLTAGVSNEFREIANRRIRRDPLRFYVWLPMKRISSCWLTSFSTYHRPFRVLRILLVLPIVIGGLLGMALFAFNRPLNQLIVMIIVIRSVFLGYFYAPEARYIVEAYPAMIAACGVTMAVAWPYLVRRAVSLRRVKGINSRAN